MKNEEKEKIIKTTMDWPEALKVAIAEKARKEDRTFSSYVRVTMAKDVGWDGR